MAVLLLSLASGSVSDEAQCRWCTCTELKTAGDSDESSLICNGTEVTSFPQCPSCSGLTIYDIKNSSMPAPVMPANAASIEEFHLVDSSVVDLSGFDLEKASKLRTLRLDDNDLNKTQLESRGESLNMRESLFVFGD